LVDVLDIWEKMFDVKNLSEAVCSSKPKSATNFPTIGSFIYRKLEICSLALIRLRNCNEATVQKQI